MVYVEDGEGEEHRHLVEDVHVPLIIIKYVVDGGVGASGELDDAVDDAVLHGVLY